MVRVIDSRPELSGKFAKKSHIGYRIQIYRLKIRQGSSFRASRLLRLPVSKYARTKFSRSMALKVKSCQEVSKIRSSGIVQ
ncbi:hypothetical protein TNCV_590291 [Trichonephila clavipes]|nr:hypothetical protein TNCV_590291 [Trichonephila clavipes]